MLYEISTDRFNDEVIAKIKSLWKDKDTLVTVTGIANKPFMEWLDKTYGKDIMCTMPGLHKRIYYRPRS